MAALIRFGCFIVCPHVRSDCGDCLIRSMFGPVGSGRTLHGGETRWRGAVYSTGRAPIRREIGAPDHFSCFPRALIGKDCPPTILPRGAMAKAMGGAHGMERRPLRSRSSLWARWLAARLT